jgi:hypothetical protein
VSLPTEAGRYRKGTYVTQLAPSGNKQFIAINICLAIGGTMPAEHGTRLLRLVDDAVREAPIERWLVGADAVPVTAEGPQNDRAYVVELGSGLVIAPGSGAWPTQDGWLKRFHAVPWEAGEPEHEALLGEIQKRELDI